MSVASYNEDNIFDTSQTHTRMHIEVAALQAAAFDYYGC